MSTVTESCWLDRSSSWWAKLDRAAQHIHSLQQAVNEFRAREPFVLKPEATANPEVTAYRLQCNEPIPLTFSTTFGDILSNLSAALESLAFGLSRQSAGGTLTEKQEKETRFPLCATPDEFDVFKSGAAGKLLDERATSALRAVQSFVGLEQQMMFDPSASPDFAVEFTFSYLHRLNKLWNIDKHRRLVPSAYRPDLVYWSSDGPSKRKVLPGDRTLACNSILFRVEGKDDGVDNEVYHDYILLVKDDPAFIAYPEGPHEDFVKLAQGCHSHIANFVVPTVARIMQQQPSDD